jgi:acetoin utilization deacetylase AcuC-like enzyme
MHEVSATIAGASIGGVNLVMEGAATHAFNPAGGLHHAQRDWASGFCVYNDVAVAIARAVREFGARVLYLDFDAHHGDGVQAAFYDDPRVVTVSFHETGRHLFPGTGEVLELGTGPGLGSSLNIPLEPYTDTEMWTEAVDAVLPPLFARFRPDLVVAQFGCDAHAWDPLTHLLLTTQATAHAARLTHDLSHEFCDGRLLATGGGGYEVFRVVPRAWSIVWATLVHQPLPARVPDDWIQRWQPQCAPELPATWQDAPSVVPPVPRRNEIALQNRRTVDRLRTLVMSPAHRHAYPGPTRTDAGGVTWGRPRTLTIESPKGPLILTDRTSGSQIDRLTLDSGLSAFGHSPGHEKVILHRIASRAESDLTIASTPEGTVVGQVSIAPPVGRWVDLPGIMEVAVEVAPAWRRSGVARRLLTFALDRDAVEDLILLALGLSWHWDLDGSGIPASRYRELVVRLFSAAGFSAHETDDEEVRAAPENVLLARIGSRVGPERVSEFERKLLVDRGDWWGF